MTRINAGIKPHELPRQLLLAELREIKRIPNTITSGRADLTKQIPQAFTLNKGHVRFFYDKGGYTLKRYKALRLEAVNRGYKVTDFSGAWDNIPSELMKDYTPTEDVREQLKFRIEIEKGIKLLTQS